MPAHLIQFDELQQVTGYTRQADVERCLQRQGVRFFRGRNGAIWTTLEALNVALGVSAPAANSEGPIKPEDFF